MTISATSVRFDDDSMWVIPGPMATLLFLLTFIIANYPLSFLVLGLVLGLIAYALRSKGPDAFVEALFA